MHTPAGLLCRGTVELTATIRGAGQTYGETIRQVAAGYRESARRMVEAEGTGALVFSVGRDIRQLSSQPIWLRGRVMVPKAERIARKARGQTPIPLTPVRFRSDSVTYSVLEDAEGIPNGLSFDTRPGDASQRAAHSKASDRQSDRQYEVGTEDSYRVLDSGDWGIDRTTTRTVPAAWFDPDRPRIPTLISGHSGPTKFLVDIDETYSMDGDPLGRQVLIVNGTTLGTHLVTNPDFWLIHTAHGGDVVFHACRPGGVAETGLQSRNRDNTNSVEWGPVNRHGTILTGAAEVMHRHGLDTPVHGANGKTMAVAHHPDGSPDFTPVPGSRGDFERNPVPELSSVVVMPGKDPDGNSVPGTFLTIHPPSATSGQGQP